PAVAAAAGAEIGLADSRQRQRAIVRTRLRRRCLVGRIVHQPRAWRGTRLGDDHRVVFAGAGRCGADLVDAVAVLAESHLALRERKRRAQRRHAADPALDAGNLPDLAGGYYGSKDIADATGIGYEVEFTGRP